MLKHIVIKGLIVYCFFMGCGILDFENEQTTPDHLFPLAVGNYWVYDFTYLGAIKDTLRYEIVKRIEVPIDDTTYTSFAFNLVPFPDGAEEFYWLYRNGKQGVYLMGGISDVDTLFLNTLQRPYPLDQGVTFLEPRLAFSYSEQLFYKTDSLEVTLIDTDKEITTPAGTFSCYVFKFWVDNGPDVLKGWDYYMFYEPGIGLIAQISTTENTPEDIKEEMYLIDYRIQKHK